MMKKGLTIAVLATTIAGSALGAALEETTTKQITLDINVSVIGAPKKSHKMSLSIDRSYSWKAMLTELAEQIPAKADALSMRSPLKDAPPSSDATMGGHNYTRRNPMPDKEWQKIIANPTAYDIQVKLRAADLLEEPLEHVKLKAKEEQARAEEKHKHEHAELEAIRARGSAAAAAEALAQQASLPTFDVTFANFEKTATGKFRVSGPNKMITIDKKSGWQGMLEKFAQLSNTEIENIRLAIYFVQGGTRNILLGTYSATRPFEVWDAIKAEPANFMFYVFIQKPTEAELDLTGDEYESPEIFEMLKKQYSVEAAA